MIKQITDTAEIFIQKWKTYDEIYVTNLKGKIDFVKYPWAKKYKDQNIEEMVVLIKRKK